MHTKFIAITGGVLSGLGKGIATSSIGLLLKAHGYKVTAVKMDPYINLDAGTMRPTEHGEVFVTEDGGETDQDLGNYERFMDSDILKDHSITTGQLYKKVIEMERNLEFGGRCVEVIPHIPLEIRRRLLVVAERSKADFVLVEVGGTVGDYQSIIFLEALREMKRQLGNMIFVHVAYLPIPNNIGEMKTKPAQHSVRELNSCGIQPDFILARARLPIDDIRKEKISTFCNISPENVISTPDMSNIYGVPLNLRREKLDVKILENFNMAVKEQASAEWEQHYSKIMESKDKITVGIVGKYFDIGDYCLEDSYVSVIESVKHACWNNGVQPEIKWIDSKQFETDPDSLRTLREVDSLIVPGGFGSSGVEGKISAIRFVRENKIPYLGICYGMQLAVVEYARNVCGLNNANSMEINRETEHPVIAIIEDQIEKLAKGNYGGTMRLGAWPARLVEGSKVHSLYGKTDISERHRHRYEVNPEYITQLEDHGLKFSGVSPEATLMEFMELPGHPYFVATQAHPEFKSRPLKPAPLFDGLIKAAKLTQTL